MKRIRCSITVPRRRVRAGPLPGRPWPRTRQPPPRPTVQIAILLDTSNSMDGLIAQAKTQLWNVVNEFVRAQEGRPAPGHPGRAVRVRQGSLCRRTRDSSG